MTDTLLMPPDLAGANTPDRYVLVREVGRGGMSVVHEARDTQTGRTVALKVLAAPAGLTPAQAADARTRFAREAAAVAGLSHPNVVAIHGLGEQDGRHVLVMEFLRGETLRERLRRGPLTPAQALPVLRQVADAVDAVHARGVVHRDIKPSNVMLLQDGTAKLLDFGIARQSDDATLTGTGALVGSPAYMAPEQVRGGAGTPASDLWALGALLYEMLAGHPPFTGQNIPSVLYQVSHENPAPVAGLTAPVQRVLRRALDKNPARRCPSAQALAESLAAAVSPRRSLTPRRRPVGLVVTLFALLGLSAVVLYHHPYPPTGESRAPSVSGAGRTEPASVLPPVPAPERPKATAAVPAAPRKRHLPAHHRAAARKFAFLLAAKRLAAARHLAAAKRIVPARHARKLAPVRRPPPRVLPRHPAVAARLREQRERLYVHLRPPPRVTRLRPATHHGDEGDLDAAAAARLQKYIYSVGR